MAGEGAARPFASITKVLASLGRPRDRAAALEATLDAALLPLGLTRGAVYLRVGESEELELVASRGVPASVIQSRGRQPISHKGTGLAGSAAHRKGPVVIIDLTREASAQPLVDAFRQAGVALTSAAAVPVTVEGRAVGAIVAVSERAREFSADEVAYLDLVGNALGWTLVAQRALNDLAKTVEELNALARALEQRTAELKDLDRYKTKSIQLITHELRRPLSPIFTYADMLLSTDYPPEKRKEFLARIREAAGEMDKYVAEMIGAAKLEEGGVQLMFGEVDLAEVTRTAVGTWQQAAADAGVALDLAIELTPARFTTDGAKIGAVLENLIENAVKYTPQGGRVTVALRKDPVGIQLSVRDTGIGIPKGEIPELFGKFRIVSRAEVPRPAHRAGLGLYLAKVYTEALGGTISVESELGKGSTFTLRVPVAPRP